MKYIVKYVFALSVCCFPAFSSADQLIDDFASSEPLAWTFDNGSEYSGARGGLSFAPGYSGSGLKVSYDFSGGGAYVSASQWLDQPVRAAALGFWVNTPPGIQVRLRVVDSTYQTLQYHLTRPLSTVDEDGWYRQVVDLSAPSAHWGGANDGVLHGEIQLIKLMAGDPLDALHVAGAVYFDQLLAIGQLRPAINPFEPLKAPLPGTADFVSNLAVSTHVTQDPRLFDIAADLGFKWVRMGLYWDTIERQPGRYDWSVYDRIVDMAQARGLNVLFHLSYGNPLYGGDPTTPAAIEAYVDFARAAAAHFKGKDLRFEIWNEPNHPRYFSEPGASTYAQLAQQAIAAMHAVDPAAQVSTGGLSAFDFAFLRAMLQEGAAQDADAISLHPYRGRRRPESFTAEVRLMRLIVDRYASSAMPVWDTEWGYTSAWFGPSGHWPSARHRQAVMVVRRLAAARAVGFAYPTYYELVDAGSDGSAREHNFGLVTNDLSYKAAAFAVKTMVETLGGRRFAGFIELQPSSLHGLVFDGTDNTVVMLWSSAAGGGLTVTLPESVTRAVDLYGDAIPMVRAPDGDLTLQISEAEGPVYLTYLPPEPTEPPSSEPPPPEPEPEPEPEPDPGTSSQRMIGSFDRDGLAGWTFDAGEEFPGAEGSLSLVRGYYGDGAKLAYDLRTGGRYVAAVLWAEQPFNADAVGFWVKSPTNIRLRLRIVDSTMQTLQYTLPRPAGADNPDAWYRQWVDLAVPAGHWGGADDGVVHEPIQAIKLMAGDPPQPETALGAVYFDQVVVYH